MSDDHEPATKQDLQDVERRLTAQIDHVHNRLDGLGVRLEAHNIKLDAFWTASDRVQRLAFALLITAWAGILGTFVTVLVRR